MSAAHGKKDCRGPLAGPLPINVKSSVTLNTGFASPKQRRGVGGGGNSLAITRRKELYAPASLESPAPAATGGQSSTPDGQPQARTGFSLFRKKYTTLDTAGSPIGEAFSAPVVGKGNSVTIGKPAGRGTGEGPFFGDLSGAVPLDVEPSL